MKKAHETHLFHAVLEVWMISQIERLASELQTSFSEMINVLFALYRHRIYRMQCSLEDQDSRYRTLEQSQDKNVGLLEINYQQLKKMHHDYNFFSISQILRLILEGFLELVAEHGLQETIALLEKEAIKARSKTHSRTIKPLFQGTSKEMHLKNVILALYSKDFKLICLDIYPPGKKA